jgi:hypothetical protein
MSRPRITLGRAAVGIALLLAVVAVAVVIASGGDSDETPSTAEADLQTVSFQEPEDPGPDPFTKPADVEGDEEVDLPASGSGGEQPFGGSGSNRVCDRDKLIRFLRRNPAVMREWARVLGVEPTFRAVRRYIAKLHPVTLTRDTQVTNHAYRNGRAVPFQAILQAGTAVLVDEYGTPVVRCFCGNPLKPAVFTPTAKCNGCPPDYKPPRQCKYGRRGDYDETYYRRDYYTNGAYDEVFIRRSRSGRYRDCYEAYPDPPTVTIVDVFRAPPPEPEPPPQATTTTPAPQTGGLQCDPPRSQLEAEQCAAQRGEAPQNTPVPEPEPAPAPAPEPAPTPGICNDGQDNEGVPGLIDGDDPNCQ